jgi:hypothetical protein
LVLEVEADRIACEVLGGTRFSEFTADAPEIARFWGPAGHYWTIYLISLAAGWSRHAALTNAFYAQMPDQVEELDATEAGEDYLKTYAEKLLTPQALMPTPPTAIRCKPLIMREKRPSKTPKSTVPNKSPSSRS